MNERYFPGRYFPGEEFLEKRLSRRGLLKLGLIAGGFYLVKQALGRAFLEGIPLKETVEKKAEKLIEPLRKALPSPQTLKPEVIKPPEKIPIRVSPEKKEIELSKTKEAEVSPERGAEVKTGIELLENLGLKEKIVYILYGRPQKAGEQTWGSLGATQTAEQSWEFLHQTRKEQIAQAIKKDPENDFALNILNPVYRAPNGTIEDIYVQKALELAAENHGLVALDFSSYYDAQQTIERLESTLPKELLPFLAVSLDVEHFPGRRTDAAFLNAFVSWFANKHQEWSGNSLIPGLVTIYTFHGSEGTGKIDNLEKLNQYLLPQKTLVVLLFDGQGSKEQKLSKMGILVNSLTNTPEFPALVGVMEFRLKWGQKYDKSEVKDIFDTLQGAPTFFFASQ